MSSLCNVGPIHSLNLQVMWVLEHWKIWGETSSLMLSDIACVDFGPDVSLTVRRLILLQSSKHKDEGPVEVETFSDAIAHGMI